MTHSGLGRAETKLELSGGKAYRSFSDGVFTAGVSSKASERYLICMLDNRTCEEAMHRRDPAFDGLFFVGVKTTGIYCRPVCRARMPRRENISFYPSAAAAEQAGFRPCMRCRPEAAPFCPAWMGSRSTVERALKLIDDGALDRDGVDVLANRLGVGVRQLSRLFKQHLQASPLQIAKTRRVQRAKRLLDTTDLTVAEVAARAGFSSARRMSAAFADLYGRAPSKLRRPVQQAPPP